MTSAILRAPLGSRSFTSEKPIDRKRLDRLSRNITDIRRVRDAIKAGDAETAIRKLAFVMDSLAAISNGIEDGDDEP